MRRSDSRLVQAALAAILVLASASAPATERYNRYVRQSLTLQNPGAEAITAKVWVYAPVSRTSTQQLERVEVNEPHQVTTDALGNRVIELTNVRLAPYESRVVTMGSHLSLSALPERERVSDTANYLRAEKFIESDDRQIRELATKLRAAKPAASAKAIYEWIRANIAYSGYDADEYGAKRALERRRGDCTEFADLTVALARALEIPSRTVGGFVVESDTVLRAAEYHNWAELYFDGGWQLVDTQRGAFAESADRYIAFHLASTSIDNPMQGAERFRTSAKLLVRME